MREPVKYTVRIEGPRIPENTYFMVGEFGEGQEARQLASIEKVLLYWLIELGFRPPIRVRDA